MASRTTNKNKTHGKSYDQQKMVVVLDVEMTLLAYGSSNPWFMFDQKLTENVIYYNMFKNKNYRAWVTHQYWTWLAHIWYV